jgi:hypothetical protein
MTGLLGRLIEGMAAVKDEALVGIADKIGPGEIFICELLDPDARRLFAYHGRLVKETNPKIEASNAEPPGDHGPDQDGICPKCLAALKLAAEAEQINAIGGLIWPCIKATLTEADLIKALQAPGGVALREGWKIVALPERPNPLESLEGSGLIMVGMPPGMDDISDLLEVGFRPRARSAGTFSEFLRALRR